MLSREGNYSVCTAKPVTPSTSFSTIRQRGHELTSRTALALPVAWQVSLISISTICDTQRQPGLRTPALTLERSWRYLVIAVFKHLRVTPTPPTRVCDRQWKRWRNGNRGPTQNSPQ